MKRRPPTKSTACFFGVGNSLERSAYFVASYFALKENPTIRRPYRAPAQEEKKGPKVNGEITSNFVQLVDHEGVNHGSIATVKARELAEEAGLDLVEIVPDRDPPVCKLLDYGKFKFQQQKRAAEARKKQKTIEVKEIKMRPNIDTHDYGVKMKAVHRFLNEGDKVKITIRFRGREMAHQDLGAELLRRVTAEVEESAKIEMAPKLEGRQMMMIIAPK